MIFDKSEQYLQQFISVLEPSLRATTSDTRTSAWNQFKKIGFPTAKSEAYRHMPILPWLRQHFNPEQIIKPASLPQHIDDLTPFLSKTKHHIVLVNGVFNKQLSTIENSSALTISTLAQAMEMHSDIVINHLGKHENKQDPFALFNTAIWKEGIFIYLREGAVIDEPIVIHHLHDASREPLSVHNRILVVAEQRSALHIVEKTTTCGSHPVFNTLTEELIVKNDAVVEYSKIQHKNKLICTVNNTHIHQMNRSRSTTRTFTFDGKLVRNNLHVTLDGEQCTSNLYGMYLLQNDTRADNHTVVDHKKPNSYSNEFYKGLLDGNAKGVFDGKIYVRPNAQKTNAFQSNKTILLSEKSSINAKPQLEIWADDVKCSHGCTSGQLDENVLFYLQSRGLSRATATALLSYAFASELLTKIEHSDLKKNIEKLVNENLKCKINT